jgi:phosphoribosyl-AMP cyclohydrolase / phosphoribosyl-ATP pyrophosphohydrolase
VNPEKTKALAWDKSGGLLPIVVQHARSGKVLMLGYMNAEALDLTLQRGRVVFYSRSRQRLWTKGETSGHYLEVVEVSSDCDDDALLVLAEPAGPTCHKGTDSCFASASRTPAEGLSFLADLEAIIERRIEERPEGSYTARVYGEGAGRIAQKLGEEGVELALAAVSRDDDAVVAESADLLYHLLLLLKSRGLSAARVVSELKSRHEARKGDR